MKTTEKYSTALCYQSTHPPLDVLLQQNTEPIILAFELKARKAAGLPGCFLTWAQLVKKGFPGTDTELTRHFVTLFADRHWWGVSIYTSGGCLPDSKLRRVLLKILHSGCNNCFCSFIHNWHWCSSSTDGSPQILSPHSIHIYWNWRSRKTIFFKQKFWEKHTMLSTDEKYLEQHISIALLFVFSLGFWW